ncbi:hypothetical protein GGQ87_001945 [Brevundimonas alba]|uniref:Fimbrial biogenesis outer membrane usher protein n=1 Tax=Brevundimonas alba TaxID=74314 RepID=A0A7X5YL86_9CAUL|nr:hypothetical protein [Brevundimonas alba]NJC41687.1 hypothetical protein [Brevundimonas alba]
MSRARLLAAAGVGLSVLGAPSVAPAQDVVASLVQAADPQPFSPDDLLFMEVTADGYQLAETMNVYSSRSGVFVPLGEFARVLDFAVGVFPAESRAEGWVGSRDRELQVDLRRRQATVGGRTISFEAGQAAIYDGDVYLRLDLIELLLPVRLRADVSAQTLAVAPTEPLPFQQRLAREQRAAGLGGAPANVRVLEAPAPYTLFTAPSFDVNLGGQIARDGSNQTQGYDVRMAGDLLYTGFQGFVGSDQDGAPNDVRVLFERKDPDGRALGPLGGTRAGAGDVFTPSMSLGAGSFGGRGVYYTSAPLEALDLSTPLDLRGELPLGEDVELYVNEVLQATQASATAGRYEFLDVPLTYGLNTIRLVFYGPQGETREEVRRVNFGAGQAARGQLVFRFGAVEQNIPVFDVGERIADASTGEARVAALFDYGLSSTVTISGGFARYTPQGREARSIGTAGLRASLGGLAAQLDLAADSEGGSGATLGLAARPFGVSLVGRHSEYRGGFVDETRQPGFGAAALMRSSDLRADAQWEVAPWLTLPLSLDMRRLEREDGTDLFTAEMRTSAPVNRYYLSTALAYENEKTLLERRDRLVGSFDVATLVAARAQLRGGVSYELSPDAGLDTAYANLDYQISERRAVRLGVVRTLGAQKTTTLQASGHYRADRFDIALTAAWEADRGDWQVGVQLGFGLAFDPYSRRYGFTRPGVSSGGLVAVNAFVDANGDGRRQADEAPVSNVVLETPAGGAVTGIDGRVLATGLGDGGRARMRVNIEGLDDPFLVGSADVVQTVPRPGRVTTIDYPLQVTGEVEITARLRRDGAARTLAALELRLIPDKGDPIAVRTDHAGVAFVDGVRPGRYRIELDPDQARDLGLELTAAPELVMPPSGGFVRGGDIFVAVKAPEAAQ